jgi:predicted esterase
VLGFSQGAATAGRWAVLGETAIDRLVLWGGAPAHDLDLGTHADTLQQLDLTIVLGTEDPYVSDERRSAVRAQLAHNDIPVTVHTYEGGHHLDREMLTQIIGAAS